MKKLYYLVLMICSICAFTACSDDKDDNPTPQVPVTGLSIPSPVALGEDVNILGTGFTEAARLYVKDAKGTQTEVTISERLSTGLTVVFPVTLAVGDYTLLLQQGGEWELGKIKLTAAKAPLPITDLRMPDKAIIGETLVLEGANFPENGAYYLQDDNNTRIQLTPAETQTEGSLALNVPSSLQEGSYTLILVVGTDEWKVNQITVTVPGPKRLKSITVSGDQVEQPYSFTLHYNADGKVDSIKLKSEGTPQCENWSVEYTATRVQMKMTGANWEGDAITSSMDMTLQDGKVTKNVYVDAYEDTYDAPFTYDGDNKLESIQYGSLDYYTFNAEQYTYKNGDLDSCATYLDPEFSDLYGGFRFFYEGEQIRENGVGADILGIILYTFNFDKSIFYPHLLGLCGKAPAHLPTKVTGDFRRDFAYEGENQVSKVSMSETYDYGGGLSETYTTYVLDLGYESIPE